MIRIILFSLAVCMGCLSCVVITDFPNPEDKLDLSEELGGAVSVSLNQKLGVVNMAFTEELPVGHSDEIYSLIGSEILLTVHNDNNVSVSLTSQPVDGTPDAPGEYAVNVDEDNKNVTLTFFNKTAAGQALRANGTYEAVLQVSDNDYFETGSILLNVDIQ